MHRAPMIAALTGLCAAAALSSCGGSTGPDYPLQCIFELNPVGAYEYPAGTAAPTVVPGEGGTQEGADALNACIRAKAAATSTTPASVGASQQSAIETNGAVVTETYTYGTPPAARLSAPTQAAAPSSSSRLAAPQPCRLEMTGGTGYTCAP